MALVPDAQALTDGSAGPLQPYLIAMVPAAILGIIIGMKYGDTYLGPLVSSFSKTSSNVPMPPIPDPKYTPALSGSKLPSIPESVTA